MSGPTIRERIEALRPWPEGEPLIRALLAYEKTVTRSASPTPNLDAMREAERAARAAAPLRPLPDPVAGLREADQETWRQRIVEHLGPQRMSLYMSKDIDRMATGAVIAAALLDEPVPPCAGCAVYHDLHHPDHVPGAEPVPLGETPDAD